MARSPKPRNSSADSPTAPLSVTDPGDALALVQHSFGHLPQDSLVILGLLQGFTGGHLRVDLEPALQNPVPMGRRCAQWLAGAEAEPVPEAVLVVILDSAPPAPDTPARHDSFLAALSEELQQLAEVRTTQVWHAGGGRIRDYHCHDGDCCPYPGERVAEVLDRTLQRVPELIPSRTPSPQEQVAAFLATSPLVTGRSTAADWDRPDATVTPMQTVKTVWESALDRTQRCGAADWLHTTKGWIPALLGPRESLTTAGLIMQITGADDPWGDSPEPPPWERVEALDQLLHQLVPYAQPHQLEQLLGLKAWTEWIRGCGSSTDAFAAAVQQRFPERWADQQDPPLAALVRHWMSTVGVCPWARVKRTSYSWWKSSR